MPADVAGRQRAIDRVGQRMHADIGIRMAEQCAIVRHAHAAEHDMIALGEGMNVEALAAADIHVPPPRSVRPARNRPAR